MKTTLGLDIGIASCGWSLIEFKKNYPARIVDAGVRVFPEGMEIDPRGKTESRNMTRREKRLHRRLLDRRAMRKSYVRKILVAAGMAPSQQQNPQSWRQFERLDPYAMRAKGLDQSLDPQQFGRAIYHIAQRRGFLSNRKSQAKATDEAGIVASATSLIEEEMKSGGFRTLGEYFNSMQSRERRIRGNYTLRRWYVDEFDKLWQSQSRHHPDLYTDNLRTKLSDALFFQRPLKIKKSTIGKCQYESRKSRCRIALLETQRFRLLQQVNNLRIEEIIGVERELSNEERLIIIQHLEINESATFPRLRRLLGLNTKTKFNLERGGADKILGDSTSARVVAAIGDARWLSLSAQDRSRLVNDLMSIDHPGILCQRAISHWNLDESSAEALSEVHLEDGHASLSLQAISKLMPLLEQGLSYMSAAHKIYPAHRDWVAQDFVPPFEDLRNPLVQRALAETRRVVNAVIRKHGKPDRIRIEVARDLKQASKERVRDWERMRKREKERSEAREAIQRLKEYNIPNPKAADIEKWLLYKECRCVCPYTGKAISEAALFGDHPQFDIEHIVPFSRSLDNSFANKTLCCASYNRNIKKNLTPYEAAAGTSAWPDIVKRAEGFLGDFAEAKLRRFLMSDVPEEQAFLNEFTSRDLAVTRYATRAAAQALQRIYTPQEAYSCIQVTPGQVTSFLRRAWGLNDILGLSGTKTRDDHRQHAIDATVVALTTPATVQALANAAVRGRAGAFSSIECPWDSFHEDLAQVINSMHASHRLSKNTNGQLHKDTHYGLVDSGASAGQKRAVLRRFIHAMSPSDVNNIVDMAVRKAVQTKLQSLGEADPKKAFKERANHPVLMTKGGESIPVHRARIFQQASPYTIESAPGVRRVELRNNHHAEFFEVVDRNGKMSLKGVIVPMIEVRRIVARARRAGVSPVIVRPHDEEGNRLAFSLAIGEVVELDWKGERIVCVVQKLSERDYNFRRINDARMAKDAGPDTIRICSDSSFIDCKMQKMIIDPLGRIYRTRD